MPTLAEMDIHGFPELNPGVDIRSLSTKSERELQWACPLGHQWSQRVLGYVNSGGRCPYCSNKRTLTGFNDLATTHPELAAQWITAVPTPGKSEKSLPASPREARAGQLVRVQWQCPQQPEHQWVAVLTERTNTKRKPTGCPYCAGKKVLTGSNDLETVLPQVAAYWHPTKNGELLPSQVTAGSAKVVWWQCPQQHEWENRIYEQTVKHHQCSTCAQTILVPGLNDFATVHPKASAEWHPTKNDRLPNEVSSVSGYRAWWKCEKEHEWEAKVSDRSTYSSGCPICSNHTVLKGFNDLASSGLPYASEWHPTKNLPLTPDQVTSGSNRTIWWKCNKGHEWLSTPNGRQTGYGCLRCAAGRGSSEGEKEVTAFITHLLPEGDVDTHVRLSKIGEFDILIKAKQIAVEYNGLHWHSDARTAPEMARLRHYKKWQAAQTAGVQLIQVWEDEWKRNPEQVKRMLAHKLGVQLPGERKVMARKTQVAAVTKRQAEIFLNEHHIQGFASGSHYLGLVELGDIDSLVAVLVLKKEAGTEGKTLNIIRYATAATVSGGFTKLLKHAERTYEPDSFITFSDNCVSDGGLYRNNGFITDKELPPDYMYVVRGERKHKFGYRLKRFRDDPALQYHEGMTESELAQLNGLPRIWDAGKTRWVKNTLPTTGTVE